MSMKIKSGFMAFALRMPSSPFSAAAVLKPCFSSAFCITKTSVGESSTMRISAIDFSPSFPDVRFNCAQQFVLSKRLGQIMLRPYDAAACAVEQSVLAREHDYRNLLENFVVLYQRAGLVAIQSRHHDIDEHDVRLMIRNLGKCVETIHRREDFAAFLGEEGFS